MAESRTWLVTGASSGIGSAIALAAIKAGHKVIACARDPEKAAREHADITPLGGQWLQLDVAKRDCQERVSKGIEARGGRIDVVVNNAGYLLVGSIEDLSDDEMQQSMDTNFFGAIRVLKGALPYMRAQRSGTIINISSINGLVAEPGCSMYCASKSAMESLSEALVDEVAPFNIRVMAVEPGQCTTNVFGAMRQPAAATTQDYADTTVGYVVDAIGQYHVKGKTTRGDPQKLAERVVEFTDGVGMAKGLTKHLRLFLGQDCTQTLKGKLESLQRNLDAMGDIAASTDWDGWEPSTVQ